MSKDQSLTKNDFRNKGWNALKGTATIREGLERLYEEVVTPLLEENKRLKEQVKELEGIEPLTDEEIKEQAESYAGVMIWINKQKGYKEPNPEDIEFHEYISKQSYLDGYKASQERILKQIK